jgi:hypothetical protein
MMTPIRVVPKKKEDKLDPISRVNFARIYTVEHNVKVYEFGDVHRDSMADLRQQWQFVLERDVNRQIEEIDKKDEDEDNDDDDEDGDDDDEDGEEESEDEENGDEVGDN